MSVYGHNKFKHCIIFSNYHSLDDLRNMCIYKIIEIMFLMYIFYVIIYLKPYAVMMSFPFRYH